MELEKCKDCEVKICYGKEVVCAICRDNERRIQELKDKGILK